MCIYIYVCMYVCICKYLYVYIYTFRAHFYVDLVNLEGSEKFI